ncbi:MAG: hypothetical protein WC420_00250 [Candidatus Paceibacterota bacterium]
MKFLKFANSSKAKGLLSGNDNIIGSRIGEFIAWQLLNNQKRHPKINKQSNIKGFDIICSNGPQRISVKLIGPENKIGRINRLGNDWDEFILIILNENYKIEAIGQINKKQFNLDKKISKNPYVSRNMLGRNGLFNRSGKVCLREGLERLL